MQKFYCFLLFLFQGISLSLCAQTSSLSGVVSTQHGSRPLPGANVYFENTNIGTATNNKGYYEFEKLAPGNYTLIVSFSGYRRVRQNIELKPGPNECNFAMEPSSANLGEVVVTGTGTAHHLKKAPVPTELINSKAVKSVGADDFNNLMLRLSPSFDFNPGTMGPFMKLNGLGNDYIVVLIDGKRMYGDLGGNSDLNRINPDNIERIEILKGASSLLYGSDAIAGVVNVITRKSKNRNFFSNSTRFKEYNTWQQNNAISVEAGAIASHTSFSRKSSDGWQLSPYEWDDDNGDGIVDEDELTGTVEKTMKAYKDFTVTQRFEFSLSPKVDIYSEGTYYQKDMFRNPSVLDYGYYFQDHTYGAGGKYLLGNRDYISLDYHHDRFLYYYRYNHDDEDGYFLKDQKKLNNDQRLDNVRLKYLNTFSSDNRLTVGVDYMNEEMVSADRLVNGEADAYTLALYGQDEMTLFSTLDVVAGIRYVYHKEFGSAVTPKISVLWNIHNFNIRGTFGTGFKAPTLKELYYHYEMRGWTYLGNTELEPQTSEYFSAGVEYNSRPFSLSATVYRNNVDNLIDYVLGDESKVKIHDNIAEARSQGLDLLLEVKTGFGITLSGGYSYVDARNLTDDIGLEGVAMHNGNVRLTYDHRWGRYGFNANIMGRIQGDKFYDGEPDAKGYDLWTLTTSHAFYQIGQFNFELSAGVDNIFDYVDDSPLGAHYGTLSPGRTFFLGIRFNFSE